MRLNFLALPFSACIGFYIAPKGAKDCSRGWNDAAVWRRATRGSDSHILFCPCGAKEFIHCGGSSAPSGADISRDRFHGLRCAGFAGLASPVATIRRPIRGEKPHVPYCTTQANNNDNKVLHSAMNFNHTPKIEMARWPKPPSHPAAAPWQYPHGWPYWLYLPGWSAGLASGDSHKLQATAGR